MNYKDALNILGFSTDETITKTEITKRYRKLALQYHPDKNNNSETSKELFQNLTEAYDIIMTANTQGFNESKTPETTNPVDYNSLFNLFMDGFKKNDNSFFVDIIKEIAMSGYKKISVSLFERIDKHTATDILAFVMKYRHILHISDDIIDQVKITLHKKFEKDQIYILNPTLNDMVMNNIFKLNVEGKIYYVPLWHNEVYFDGKDGDIIVKCIPDLPENVTIDENNTIHMDVREKIQVKHLKSKCLEVNLEGKCIHIHNLSLNPIHSYYFPNEGIPEIIENDICAVDKKAGLHVNVIFTD